MKKVLKSENNHVKIRKKLLDLQSSSFIAYKLLDLFLALYLGSLAAASLLCIQEVPLML